MTDKHEQQGFMKEPTKHLSRRYNAITIGGAVALLVLVSVLFFLQFRDLKATQKKDLGEKLSERAASFDAFLGTASFYVNQMHNTFQDRYTQNTSTSWNKTLASLPRTYENGRYFAIDHLPAEVDSHEIGNLFGLGDYEVRIKGESARELRASLALFPLFKSTHRTFPNIALSYYQSIHHFTAMYPWTATSELTSREAGMTIEQLIDGVLELDLVTLARPENNPKRAPYWTPVYMDPAGQGLMVTHGYPVYRENNFIGVVATDVTLGALSNYVSDLGYEKGIMLVVNNHEQVLASSANNAINNKGPRPLHKVLPPDLLPALEAIQSARSTFESHGYVIDRHPLQSAPWSVIFIMPKTELNRLSFYGIWGYVAIVLGLCLFLLAVYIQLQRGFVRPAIALTAHIRAEAADGSSHSEDVPEMWREWFTVVSDTFALRHVTANVPGAVYQLRQRRDGGLEVIFMSNGIKDLLGIEPQDFMEGRIHMREIFNDEDVPKFLSSLEVSARNLSHYHFVCSVHTTQGETKWVRFASNPRAEADGCVIWEGLILDITKRVLAQKALSASENRLRSIMDASLFPLVVSRISDHSIAFINDRANELFQVDGRRSMEQFGPELWADDGEGQRLLEGLETEGFENREVQFKRTDDSHFWVLMSAMAIRYEDEECLLFTFTDITRRKELEGELKKLATTDPLTGASNRRHFLELGEREWHRAARGVGPLSVLMLDIDHFKRINDSYGHPGGDEALVQTVACIKQKIRNIDILGRLGGEEFAIVLPNADIDTAVIIGNRLREAVSQICIEWEGNTIQFTISIGATPFKPEDTDLEAIMNRADQALYEAKEGGRNRVSVL